MFARLEPKQHTAMVVRTMIDKAVKAVYPNSWGFTRVQGIVNPDPRMRCGKDVASLIGDKIVCTHTIRCTGFQVQDPPLSGAISAVSIS